MRAPSVASRYRFAARDTLGPGAPLIEPARLTAERSKTKLADELLQEGGGRVTIDERVHYQRATGEIPSLPPGEIRPTHR